MIDFWKTILWITSYVFVVVGLSVFGIHRWIMVWLFWKNHKKHPKPVGRFEKLPPVTVQLPIFNELHVVKRLVLGVAALDYPKELLQIQVLDDSTDETCEIARREVDMLVEQGFDVEYIHRVDREGFKAGALENGLRSAKGDYIFILDADFVSPPNVLREMVHYFKDERVGLVQTRWGHMNRDFSLLTRLQSIFLDGHLIVEQTARNRSGRFMNFNGTAGIWRKSAIQDSGGWQHDTLTEDLDLSYRAQMRGWKFVFLNDIESPAELPVDVNGFKSQQHRWTKGSVQTCKKLLGQVWRSKASLLVKIEATAHLTSNFVYLLLAFLCVLSFPEFGKAYDLGGWRSVFVDLPLLVITTGSAIAFFMSAQIFLRPKSWLKELLYVPALLSIIGGMSISNGKAVLEAILNRKSAFIRTPKYGVTNRGEKVQKSAYKAIKSMVVMLEVGLAVYFSWVFICHVLSYNWLSLPFTGMFVFGFWYVALGSLNWKRQDDADLADEITPATA